MTFGDYLDAAMRAAGFPSPASFSRATGVSDSVLSKWKTGTNQPSIDQLRKLEPVLGIPLLELVVAAKLLTFEEARLEAEPVPPSPSDAEDEILRSSMSETSKRTAIAALRRVRGEYQRNDPAAGWDDEGIAPRRRRA